MVLHDQVVNRQLALGPERGQRHSADPQKMSKGKERDNLCLEEFEPPMPPFAVHLKGENGSGFALNPKNITGKYLAVLVLCCPGNARNRRLSGNLSDTSDV